MKLLQKRLSINIFQATDRMRHSTLLRGAVILCATIVVFYLLSTRVAFDEVWALIKTSSKIHLLLAAILTLSFPLMSAARWKIVLSIMNYGVSWHRCLVIIVGVWPLSAVSPGKAGDFLKARSLRHEIAPMKVAGSVLTERSLDFLVLAVFAIIGGLWFREVLIVLVALGVLLAILGVIGLAQLDIPLPWGNHIRKKVNDLLVSIRLLGQHRMSLAWILLLTIANWSGSIIQTNLLFDAIGVSVGLGFVAAALPVAIFVGLIPMTMGGMGTRDSAFVVLFAAFADPSQALAVGLLYSVVAYWMVAILGIPLIGRALK